LHGSKVEIDLIPLILKRLTITGSTLRGRSVALKAAICASLKEKIWPLTEAVEISPPIHTTFHLDEAAQAHGLMASSEHTRKIVLLT
jgi:NADPH2:quinone reductase